MPDSTATAGIGIDPAAVDSWPADAGDEALLEAFRPDPPRPAPNCVLPESKEDEESWLGQENRDLARFPVQASRPIALRQIDAEGKPLSCWYLADILDISRGGLCLVANGLEDAVPGSLLQLDVRCHPDFGVLRLDTQVRWCSNDFGFISLGVAFLTPLEYIPRLEVERRLTRRDPNSEPWAQE